LVTFSEQESVTLITPKSEKKSIYEVSQIPIIGG